MSGRARVGHVLSPRALSVVVAATLAQATLGATCVDGATPDCDDPMVQCGPSLDAAPDVQPDVVLLPDATPERDAGRDADPGDAEADADPDAGDAS